MRHRPPISTTFITSSWKPTPSRPFSFNSATFITPLRLSFQFALCQPLPLHPCMVSHSSDDDDLTTNTHRSSYPLYDSTSSQATPGQVPSIPSDQSPDVPHSGKRLVVAGAALLALFTAGSVAAATRAFNSDTLVSLAAWFETLGPSAIFLYGSIYFFLELVAVPALPLTLGSGYLFGLVKGTAAVSVASTLAAAASFLIARYGLRDAIANLATRYPRFRAMDRAIGKEGFKFVFLLRLSPLLPFAISNYLYGLTSVNLREYVLGSWLGMLPGTIAYVSAGAAVSALADLSAGKSNVNPILVVIGVAATIGALTFIGKMAADSVDAVEEEEVAQRN